MKKGASLNGKVAAQQVLLITRMGPSLQEYKNESLQEYVPLMKLKTNLLLD